MPKVDVCLLYTSSVPDGKQNDSPDQGVAHREAQGKDADKRPVPGDPVVQQIDQQIVQIHRPGVNGRSGKQRQSLNLIDDADACLLYTSRCV